MAGRKPTLGYPSRTEAVMALRGQGLSSDAIAGRIGITAKDVRALEDSRAKTIAKAQSNRTVLFPLDVLDKLKPHATRRGTSVNDLCRRIIEAVVDDNIVNAILDDMEASA